MASAHDRVLALQQAFDRVVRRLRRGGPPERAGRRLLIVQIDGLSRTVLQHALASGRMPFMKRLLRERHYEMEPMSVGLPTSTPAFQMATFYGVRPDIPGFHYYDRDRQGDIHFPRAGHAAWVQEKHAADRRGILQGGSAYGCCFTGGAKNNFFTFASLTRPSGRGLLSALSPFVVVLWVAAESLLGTLYELAKAVPRLISNPGRARRGWRWLWLKIGMSIWVRNFFTMAVSRDLYAGVPAIYVNYLDYDEAAHAYGPRSPRALQALRGVDRALRQVWRVVRRVPEHRYDAYILADHGQTACTGYPELSRGKQLERWIFDAFLYPPGTGAPEPRRASLGDGLRARTRESRALCQKFMNYLDEDYFRRDDPQAYQKCGVRAIAAGPNAFLYVLGRRTPLDADALEEYFPGLPAQLSQSPGIGFVLARQAAEGAANGAPLCFWQGQRFELSASQPGPFGARPDTALVLEGIADLMKMPSAGDLVIYGADSPKGGVSFISERGAHAGPSADEMQTFIVHPAGVRLPPGITHPTQLYGHFIRYQDPDASWISPAHG